MQYIQFGEGVTRREAMRLAGYSYRKRAKDWIKEEGGSGRFHARIAGQNGVHIHFDIYTDKEKHHFTFKLTEHYGREIERIAGIAREERKRRKAIPKELPKAETVSELVQTGVE